VGAGGTTQVVAQGARRRLGGVAADRGRGWPSGLAALVGRYAFDADTSRAFGVVVGIEVAAAGLGAGLLAVRRRTALIPVWIALVVGLHLVPVAALLRYPLLYVVAALVTLVALAAVPLARSRSVAISAVAGLATGTVLLATALFSIGSALLWP
jgi:hypothetical protein